MDKLLATILSTKRAHGSASEAEFLTALYARLKKLGTEPKPMALGNVVVTVNGDGKGTKNLFSCHVDTMHGYEECQPGAKQALAVDPAKGHVFLSDSTQGGCLGADDGAGIFIMLKMIEAKVQGTYIFHRGEERGCIGSRAQLAEHREWLEQFDTCIAFDRPNSYEVIITQGGMPCASKTYGTALALALNNADENFVYEVSERGVVTDSKMYAPVISECINIGVGYARQHGPDEYQDFVHLERLAKACCILDWSALVASRDPVPATRVMPRFTQPNLFAGGSGFPNNQRSLAEMAKDAVAARTVQHTAHKPEPEIEDLEPNADDMETMDRDELVEYLGDLELVNYICRLRYRAAMAEHAVTYLEELAGVS